MKQKTRFQKFIKHFKKDWQLYLLALIPMVHLLVFTYGPMYGIQLSFRDFTLTGGTTNSEWVGLKWFEDFLTDPKFMRIFMNTIILSLYSLVTFPLPIIMALILNAMKLKRYKKVVQTVSYLPHFISTTVFIGIINMVLSPVYGIYGSGYRLVLDIINGAVNCINTVFGSNIGFLNLSEFPPDFKATAEAFRHLYVWSGVWQGLGWSTILYTSALSSVSPELHEAASIDGASRFKRIIHVDLPAIMPTVGIMFVMRVGHLVGVGFEKAYLLQSNINKSTSEVISTYVYRKGMDNFKNFSYGSAVGLFNTLINLALVLIANRISKRISEGEVSLF